MELNFDNLVNEIVEKEHSYYMSMVYAEEKYGEDSYYFKHWNSKWSVLNDLAVKFNFLDKLIR